MTATRYITNEEITAYVGGVGQYFNMASALRVMFSNRSSSSGGYYSVSVVNPTEGELQPWAVREYHRIYSGEYQLTTILKWLFNLGPWYFPHISKEDPTRVAYTPDGNSGMADRQVITTIQRLISKICPLLTEDAIRGYAAEHNAEAMQEVLWAEKGEFVKIYMDGPRSCMKKDFATPIHPIAIYEKVNELAGTDILKLAYLKDRNGAITHRAIVREDVKGYVRVYGGDNRLQLRLETLGYTACGWNGVIFPQIRAASSPNRFVMPYLDGMGTTWTNAACGLYLIDGVLTVPERKVAERLRTIIGAGAGGGADGTTIPPIVNMSDYTFVSEFSGKTFSEFETQKITMLKEIKDDGSVYVGIAADIEVRRIDLRFDDSGERPHADDVRELDGLQIGEGEVVVVDKLVDIFIGDGGYKKMYVPWSMRHLLIRPKCRAGLRPMLNLPGQLEQAEIVYLEDEGCFVNKSEVVTVVDRDDYSKQSRISSRSAFALLCKDGVLRAIRSTQVRGTDRRLDNVNSSVLAEELGTENSRYGLLGLLIEKGAPCERAVSGRKVYPKYQVNVVKLWDGRYDFSRNTERLTLAHARYYIRKGEGTLDAALQIAQSRFNELVKTSSSALDSIRRIGKAFDLNGVSYSIYHNGGRRFKLEFHTDAYRVEDLRTLARVWKDLLVDDLSRVGSPHYGAQLLAYRACYNLLAGWLAEMEAVEALHYLQAPVQQVAISAEVLQTEEVAEAH